MEVWPTLLLIGGITMKAILFNSAELLFSSGLLSEFTITLSSATASGDNNRIEISYHKGRTVTVSVEGDNLLSYFNDKIKKYKDKIEVKTLSKDEAKEIVSELLEYIDILTDRRAHDLLHLQSDEVFEIKDVVEVESEDEIPEEEG